jgi:hypothetical protein
VAPFRILRQALDRRTSPELSSALTRQWIALPTPFAIAHGGNS